VSIRGIGVDIVDVIRFAAALERTPSMRERLFRESEQQLPVESLAARFAAKEALAKALGVPAGLSWHDVEVVGGGSDQGSPRFDLRGGVAEAVGSGTVHLSLSHDAGVAVAYVIVEDDARHG
jgi:holo-[acyl-carrier protein] synthase